MKYSYNWLKELANFKESPQKLENLLNMRSFEVESLKKEGDDHVLDIKLPANRYADASGHIGVACELITLLNSESQKSKPSKIRYGGMQISKSKGKNPLEIKIENPENCPRYTALVMKNITIKESPNWLKERLETCGIQSINNVVDAANYVMLESGQPLHVFDYEKIEGKQIIVRQAKSGEKLAALDEKSYELSPEILVIADAKKPLAVAGIKGGKNSGVSAKTNTIVLESANFAAETIYKGSSVLSLKTDASIRFAHGLDPNQTKIAIIRLAEFIQELAGGKIEGDINDLYPKKNVSQKILFRPSYANKIIGQDIAADFYKKTFANLGLAAAKKGIDFIVTIPTYRKDLNIEEDLVEEAARMYGYENIEARLPETILIPAARNNELFWEERIKDYLKGAGFYESQLYEFCGDQELDQFFIEKSNLVELQNPLSPETKYLVPRILIKYLSSASENLRNCDTVKIFGIGKNFKKDRGSGENKKLIIVLAKKGESGENEFYELKGMIDYLLETLRINDYWHDDAIESQTRNHDLKIYHPYRVAEIKIGDEKIGNIGEIHPEVIKNIKAKSRVAAAEIDFDKLLNLADEETEYKPIGKFPALTRDIAIIVPSDAKISQILNLITSAGGKFLIDTDLFDYFEDDNLRASQQKSIAFHLIFQDAEKTLTDKEIDKEMDNIIKAVEKKEWQIRK